MNPARLTHPLKLGTKAEVITRAVPEEVPVAIVCNGTSVGVMMATPTDLADFALGFCISEGIIDDKGEIESLDIVEHGEGIELRLWIEPSKADRLLARRRRAAGPTGCGLCGIESLQEASRALPAVLHEDLAVDASLLRQAVQLLRGEQHLNGLTHAVHAAASWSPERGFGMVREDVGRHNALDKLIGAMLTGDQQPAILLLTSRVSIELIQKAAIAGFGLIAAVSVPTALAVRTAEACNITLIGVARDDGFEVFTCGHRVRADRGGGFHGRAGLRPEWGNT
ncbi:formate dehydrogenase accessory sulfurtransferase FdhD [Pelagibacterium sp. H642]|uniref:formate dehydrogenase accessory sulfurtransferase FdhD n=1 Tax=Pelagibacterium sp. H642 TaxID=1881069 RepID=UPI0028152CE5|nr:formate dehydrogenase accessory sulfurtransferase FdhD [Pelagibacterium sp. H642]WMT91570.1 formate dehydrogenase accessory sulfurtransferase FdhD [Pelagibacterium sp. H642]